MSLKYHIWTIGCQMNEADSRHLASQVEVRGYTESDNPENADLVILNTCVVRQHAEDKIYGRLGSLAKIKRNKNPDMKIALMGCLVGVRKRQKHLKSRFPFVDVFLSPSEIEPLLASLDETDADASASADFHQVYDLPASSQAVTAFVPAVLGCSHACAFCIIPSRRGPEYSRPKEDVVREVRELTRQGIREVMLLGQIIDRYGLDLEKKTDLADLLRETATIEDLYRVRFLTSHPNWITDRLLDAVAENPQICPQMEVALQSGSDIVLERMRRGYTSDFYRALTTKIRDQIPHAAIHTDIIVGFPGETEEQYMQTYTLLRDLRFDKVHIAKYSPRPGTLAAQKYPDDIPEKEKERRRKHLDDLQHTIQREKNETLLGTTVEVLVEEKDKTRWRGRTPQNKIVFFEHNKDVRGQLVQVTINWTGPFSLIGKVDDTL